jgi:hypothetical protein
MDGRMKAVSAILGGTGGGGRQLSTYQQRANRTWSHRQSPRKKSQRNVNERAFAAISGIELLSPVVNGRRGDGRSARRRNRFAT